MTATTDITMIAVFGLIAGGYIIAAIAIQLREPNGVFTALIPWGLSFAVLGSATASPNVTAKPFQTAFLFLFLAVSLFGLWRAAQWLQDPQPIPQTAVPELEPTQPIPPITQRVPTIEPAPELEVTQEVRTVVHELVVDHVYDIVHEHRVGNVTGNEWPPQQEPRRELRRSRPELER